MWWWRTRPPSSCWRSPTSPSSGTTRSAPRAARRPWPWCAAIWSIDLLFTDINLTDGPRGFEVANAAVERWPEVKVLYASGQPLTNGMTALFVEGAHFLPKPYAVEQLEAEITALLGA